jgi:hypothetical protein
MTMLPDHPSSFPDPSAQKRCMICGTGWPPGILCVDHTALMVLKQAVQNGHHGDWPQPERSAFLPCQPTFSHIALMTNHHLRAALGWDWLTDIRALLKRLHARFD